MVIKSGLHCDSSKKKVNSKIFDNVSKDFNFYKWIIWVKKCYAFSPLKSKNMPAIPKYILQIKYQF